MHAREENTSPFLSRRAPRPKEERRGASGVCVCERGREGELVCLTNLRIFFILYGILGMFV